MAFVELFDENKNPNVLNGYEGGKYKMFVTAYVPRPHSQVKELLSTRGNIVLYDKTKKASRKEVPDAKGLSLLNDSPFYKASVTQPDDGVKTSLRDTDYLAAVNRGDMETAQQMVDQAAKEAGYTYDLYHGTNADFTEFDLRKYGGVNGKGEGYGIYLAANREISAPYGKNVINARVKFNRLAEGREKTLSFIIVSSCLTLFFFMNHPDYG